ncbi:Six-hairpin glycosidase-like protein [Biscogniauxia mediterranea]|nr:Six-hairpin glycosidase-like protein [Biscogniauxia mediterranea]
MYQLSMLVTLLLLLGSLVSADGINRKDIVTKYNVVRTNLIDNNTTPLQVGNGNFAYNVDNTGMQTFLPFNTLSSWAWHNDTLPSNGENISNYHGVAMLTHGRNVSYDTPDPSLPEASQWLISNPNRINLGRIGLKYLGNTLSKDKVSDPIQKLDLWNGIITSTFSVDGKPVKVITQGDFDTDSVVFQIESQLISSGALEVELDFPYPPIHSTKYKYEVFVGVYDFPENHTTSIHNGSSSDTIHIYHGLQDTSYHMNLRWPSNLPLKLSRDNPEDPSAITAHRYTLSPVPNNGFNPTVMSFSIHFSPEKQIAPLPSTVQRRNSKGWNQYWDQGGFIDLTASSNPKADELQRRIILSQYHVRVNSAADGQSPQESGLMNNGWYGKFHMEMVVWHNAHWVTWGRKKHFDNIFPKLYETLLPSSLARAKSMGWEGARWPKMTEVNTGVNSPGDINGLLIWQQPHPIYLAELAYAAEPTQATLERWDDVITATADYLASYAWKNESSGKYDIGPPAYGVTENTPPAESLNLAYEVAYWRYALDTALSWKARLGRSAPPRWAAVAPLLARPPVADDGLYAVYAGLNSSWWWRGDALAADPRSVAMLRGVLPATPAVDAARARRTADRVAAAWDPADIRGWGRPALAVGAARDGEPARAVGWVTRFGEWVFDDAGFAVRGGDGGTPPPYMPGNAGFLFAMAYMAAGWQGSEGHAPGFPKDGSWIVKHEGLLKAL